MVLSLDFSEKTSLWGCLRERLDDLDLGDPIGAFGLSG